MAARIRFLCGPLPRISYKDRHRTSGFMPQCRYSAHDGSAGRSNEPIVIFEARKDQAEHYISEMFVKTYDDKFGEQFRHFPLPGNATTSQHFLQIKVKNSPMLRKLAHCLDHSDVLQSTTTHERQLMTLYTFAETSTKFPVHDDERPCLPTASSLEFAVFSCTYLIRKHFMELYPNLDLEKTLTFVTLTQGIQCRAAGESDKEREEAVYKFVSTVRAVCGFIEYHGYWTGFIDPTTGNRYMGPFIDGAVLPKDERFRHFGFTVEDLSCCKVIEQRAWSPNRLVATLICNGPVKVIENLIQNGSDELETSDCEKSKRED